jgi:hypothetical protein
MQDGPGKKKKQTADREPSFPRFIGEHPLDRGVGSAIVNFYAMAISIASQGFEPGLNSVSPALDTDQQAVDVISDVAAHLTHKISGFRGDVLRKAIQESLIHASGVGYGPEPLDVKEGLERFLRKRGPKKLLELTLSSYVFNFIWIRLQDTVRSKRGSEALADSMLAIERFCVSVVKSVFGEWDQEGKLDELPPKKHLGATLIRTIQERLVEHPKPPFRIDELSAG